MMDSGTMASTMESRPVSAAMSGLCLDTQATQRNGMTSPSGFPRQPSGPRRSISPSEAAALVPPLPLSRRSSMGGHGMNADRPGGGLESRLSFGPGASSRSTTDNTTDSVAYGDPDMPRAVVPATVIPHPIVDGYVDQYRRKGVLIPLKTTLELRQDHTMTKAYITRAPIKAANSIVTLLRELLPDGKVNSLTHLRRCAKPSDMPAHLKTQYMNETPAGRLVHTGKSAYIYILVGDVKDVDRDDIVSLLSKVEGMENPIEPLAMFPIPVPLVAPISQIQAALWSCHFWPTVYRKNNPLGPHPSIVGRANDEIRSDASVWMALAHRVALRGYEAGLGEAIAAVVVQREGTEVRLVAVAADARWHNEDSRSGTGNPMAHCVMRAISMVAQKLVRYEQRIKGQEPSVLSLVFDALEDSPMLEEERLAMEQEHPTPDGYLCHGLEMYITHEPCVQCSMSVLHSRMGKVIFGDRMPLTGGMTSEDRGQGHLEHDGLNGGRGLGLFWRRELNWSMLAWEWEAGDSVPELPPIRMTMHV